MVGEYFRIEGGRPLEGTVRLPGAKNSVLPLLACALMCDGESYFTGVPRLADVEQSIKILQALGCRCEWRGRGLAVETGKRSEGELPEEPARSMRSSVFYLAPALHRFRKVRLPMPGGCRLGPRPIDIHLDGLTRMGAQASWQNDFLLLHTEKRLQGMDYTLRLPSVGATETLLMAAALAKGSTVLRGVAMEPEIVDLACFLRRCGAKIVGEGTPVIRIMGVEQLYGAVYAPIPDRIVAASLASAVAAAGGWIKLLDCRPEMLGRTLAILQKSGCRMEIQDDRLTVLRESRLKAAGELHTGSYPGFSTDAAPVVAAAFLTARGVTRIEDRVFENRFVCAEGFCAMGARAVRSGRRLSIEGVVRLHGARVEAWDLRGGAALLTAALAAEGESRVYGAGHILRGYEKPDEILRRLGARVQLETE